ncbi:hypothetical protein [uncultured Sunxiuqinia sp.]|uniref:hypothetical protein n=1 Tax=uncultured Sunxiuqinia sp. TaxID=1573825 RepID=UPI0030DC1E65
MKPSFIHRLINANTMMVEKRKQLSLVFNHNFLEVLADELNLPEPKRKSLIRWTIPNAGSVSGSWRSRTAPC